MRDAWERILSVERAGIYESNYLKANSTDGRRALWIKHNLLRPSSGPGKAELWAVLFEQGAVPIVAKREVSWAELELGPDQVSLRADGVLLERDRAEGAIADVRWSLRLSGGLAPLFHLPAWAYTSPFPKKKLLSPAPGLRFDGEVEIAGQRWPIERWVGLRGHNWGTEHAHTYAYGSCNLWDDGADRAVDGFSAKIRLGRALSPWLSAVVGHHPLVRRNGLRHWLGRASVSPSRWTLDRRSRLRSHRGARLEMSTDPSGFAGLRYAHPDGRESYCYNTKFAQVRWEESGRTYTSSTGEYEVLYPEPLPGIALHPAPGWTQANGDYRSG